MVMEFDGIRGAGFLYQLIYLSWEPKVPPPKLRLPQEIAGLMIRDYEAHWFPLIRPAIRALFLGGVALGGGGYLRFPWT